EQEERHQRERQHLQRAEEQAAREGGEEEARPTDRLRQHGVDAAGHEVGEDRRGRQEREDRREPRQPEADAEPGDDQLVQLRVGEELRVDPGDAELVAEHRDAVLVDPDRRDGADHDRVPNQRGPE
ncbi:MAG: hypothetical protein ACK56F_05035, partial [bacterium]